MVLEKNKNCFEELKYAPKNSKVPLHSTAGRKSTEKHRSPVKEECNIFDSVLGIGSSDSSLTRTLQNKENKDSMTYSAENTITPSGVTVFLKELNSVLNRMVKTASESTENHISKEGVSFRMSHINLKTGNKTDGDEKNIEVANNNDCAKAKITSKTTNNKLREAFHIFEVQKRNEDIVFVPTEFCSTDTVDLSRNNKILMVKNENIETTLEKKHCPEGTDVSFSVAALEDGEEKCTKVMDDNHLIIQRSTVAEETNISVKNEMHSKEIDVYCKEEFSWLADIWKCTNKHADIPEVPSTKKSIGFKDTKNKETIVTQKPNLEKSLKSKESSSPMVVSENDASGGENSCRVFSNMPSFNGEINHEDIQAVQLAKTNNFGLILENIQEDSNKLLRLKESFYRQLLLQNLDVETIIEISSVNCRDIQQPCQSAEYQSFKMLTNRINWNSLFGSTEECCLVKDNTNLYKWIKQNDVKPSGTRVFPDLQVLLRNEEESSLSPTQQNMLYLRDEFNCPSTCKVFNTRRISERKYNTHKLKNAVTTRRNNRSKHQGLMSMQQKKHARRQSSKKVKENIKQIIDSANSEIISYPVAGTRTSGAGVLTFFDEANIESNSSNGGTTDLTQDLRSYKIACVLENIYFTEYRTICLGVKSTLDSTFKCEALSKIKDKVKKLVSSNHIPHTYHTAPSLAAIAGSVYQQYSRTVGPEPSIFPVMENKMLDANGKDRDICVIVNSTTIPKELSSVPEIPKFAISRHLDYLYLTDKETYTFESYSLKSSYEKKSGNDRKIANIERLNMEHVSSLGFSDRMTPLAQKNACANENTTLLSSVSKRKECNDKHTSLLNAFTPSGVSNSGVISYSEIRKTSKRVAQHLKEIPTEQTSSSVQINSETLRKSAHLITEISYILQKANETASLAALQEQMITCESILHHFISVFEETQECPCKDVLLHRKYLKTVNLRPSFKSKLKPKAVDSFVDLQMIMETIQFIENKICYLEGEPTFRSMLWYDDSLYSQLLRGKTGYQQQSNFYPVFQERIKLKYQALTELQKHYNQLYEFLDGINESNSSYYVLLKCRREISECEAVINDCEHCLDFCLSVPFTCGVNFGDSLEDLERLRSSIVELTKSYIGLPRVQCDPGKLEHVWILLEHISAKADSIKKCESVNNNISVYGLEHLFFDAAKELVWLDSKQSLREKNPQISRKQLLCKLNHYALLKITEVFGCLDNGSNEGNFKKSAEPEYLSNKCNSMLNSQTKMLNIGEILNAAPSANLETLQMFMLRCTNQLETLKIQFQILQEIDVDLILITGENVIQSVEGHSDAACILLNPEAVETYIEIAMIYETIYFLTNSIATLMGQERLRSMLWFDLSLMPELINCQIKYAFYFLNNDPECSTLKTIDTALAALKVELEIISEYSEALNYPYAFLLLTREFAELSGLRELLLKCNTAIPAFFDCVPYIATVNYGGTVAELEYSYNTFATLMENLMIAPKKDLGKMAHVMKVMKSIEYLKCATAKLGKTHFPVVLLQIMENETKRGHTSHSHHFLTQISKIGGTGRKTSLINRDFETSEKHIGRTGAFQLLRQKCAYESGGDSIGGHVLATSHCSGTEHQVPGTKHVH
ncbi:testis-expressed protein 15 [Lissotriton helveticus]